MLAALTSITGCEPAGMDEATRACEQMTLRNVRTHQTLVRSLGRMRDLAADAARANPRWDRLYLSADRQWQGSFDGHPPLERVRNLTKLIHECGKTNVGQR